jgi:hypothetical protein
MAKANQIPINVLHGLASGRLLSNNNQDIQITVRSHLAAGSRAKQHDAARLGDLNNTAHELLDDVWLRIHTASLPVDKWIMRPIVDRSYTPVYMPVLVPLDDATLVVGHERGDASVHVLSEFSRGFPPLPERTCGRTRPCGV